MTTWSGSLHQTFRLLPREKRSKHLAPFLESDGLTAEEVLQRLPYDVARARARGGSRTTPDPRRYRDGRHVYQAVGLLFETAAGIVRLTELGRATRRWLPILTPANSVLLGRHAAYALSACQLQNPIGAGKGVASNVEVFPFQFIWRAMLRLEGRISSDELNRAIFWVQDDDGLDDAIQRIREARRAGDIPSLGDEVISGPKKNDRIIPWMSLASFGWTLFPDKSSGENPMYYEIPTETRHVLQEAARLKHRHRSFSTVADYVRHISRSAALPKDLR